MKKINNEITEQFLKYFGENLRRLRHKQNLTQIELAERCNVDVKKIGRTERGEYNFKIGSLIVIADGLNVHISELLNFDFPKKLINNIWTAK